MLEKAPRFRRTIKRRCVAEARQKERRELILLPGEQTGEGGRGFVKIRRDGSLVWKSHIVFLYREQGQQYRQSGLKTCFKLRCFISLSGH